MCLLCVVVLTGVLLLLFLKQAGERATMEVSDTSYVSREKEKNNTAAADAYTHQLGFGMHYSGAMRAV